MGPKSQVLEDQAMAMDQYTKLSAHTHSQKLCFCMIIFLHDKGLQVWGNYMWGGSRGAFSLS